MGGGSSKIGLIESDEGTNNQNFMYFFDPDVKTEPGPVDFYVYTLPYIIPWNQLKKWQDPTIGAGYGFTSFINIRNNGEGEVNIKELYLIQETNKISLRHGGIDCKLMSVSETTAENLEIFSTKDCPPDKIAVLGNNDENCISFTINPTILSGGNIIIACYGEIDEDSPIIGKMTEFISVDASYEYTESYTEQLACYSIPTTTVETPSPCLSTSCESAVTDTCLCGSATCNAGQFCCDVDSSCHVSDIDCCYSCGC
jgi:hypothetical protein